MSNAKTYNSSILRNAPNANLFRRPLTSCDANDAGEVALHCVSKNIPDFFDCNLRTNYHICIIFGTNISDTSCHQMTIQFSTSPSICFCTTWGNHNQRNITFLSNAIWLLN